MSNKKIDPRNKIITVKMNQNDVYKLDKLVEFCGSDKSEVIRDGINELYKRLISKDNEE